MQRYILKRVVQAVIAVIGVTIIVFMLTHITGDPVSLLLGSDATVEDVAEMREYFGFNRPLYVQYWDFLSGIVRGDFGTSIVYSRPCLDVFMNRFPNTLQLAAGAMFWALLVGLTVGAVSAVKAGHWFDNFGKIIALMGQATPGFWLAIMLILVFGVYLRWLPFGGMGDIRYLILPSLSLSSFSMAVTMRLTRSTMLDVLGTEYIKMARIKGVPETLVITKHAFKNAMIPVLTMVGLSFILLVNGTVVHETVFNWPGVGRLVVDSVLARDYPVIQTCILIGASLIVFANLFIDILYAYIDPRVRYQ